MASFVRALSSLRLTAAVLFAAAVLCVIGTAFPQGRAVTGRGHGLYSLMARHLSPYDIFHSLWLVIIGALLCLNLILCISRRPARTRRAVLVLLMHGGIVAIIAGFSLGASGIDAFMEIPEGKAATAINLTNGTSMDLGFAVRCDDFALERYENGMPKEFLSRLTFIRDGQTSGRATLMVNHPARFAGFGFYQESYRHSFTASMTVSGLSSYEAVTVEEGECIPLSRAGAHARVVKIWEDLMNAGPVVKLRIEGTQGMRYLWIFKDIDLLERQVPGLFERAPELDPSGLKPYTFSLQEVRSSYITGIGVKKDPGAPLAAAGGVVFLASLLLLFLVKGRKPSAGSNDRTREGES